MINNKILFYILIIFNTTNIWAKQTVCISLGDACGPAIMLRNLKIRYEAFPFDWTVSPFDGLYAALTSDFAYFLEDLTIRPGGQGVIDHYGIHFTHDWPTVHNPHINPLNADFVPNCQLFHEWEKALPAVKEKYRRRIERLRAMCESQNRIIFIRSGTFKSEDEAIMLRDFFRAKYPDLDFLLIAISHQDNFKTEWNIEGIKNFHLQRWDDSAGLARILQQVDPIFNSLRNQDIEIFNSESELICQECLLKLTP